MPRKKTVKSANSRTSTKSTSQQTIKSKGRTKAGSVKVKARVIDPDKPTEAMSGRMLKRYIKKHGGQLNRELGKYRERPSEWQHVDKRYRETIKRVQEAGTGKNIGKPKVIYGYGRMKKPELLLLARRIQEAERFSLEESPEEQDKKFQDSYKKFVDNHVPEAKKDKVTPSVYREMVDTFGASVDFMKDFGYEDYIQLVTDKIVEGYTARDVIKTAREIMEDIESGHFVNKDGTNPSTVDALDELTRRLGG